MNHTNNFSFFFISIDFFAIFLIYSLYFIPFYSPNKPTNPQII